MTSRSPVRSPFPHRLWRVLAWPFRVAAARAALNALARMDRRELADIGLTASDLRDVSALALDRDPTALLARRARERRRDAFAPAPDVAGPLQNRLSCAPASEAGGAGFRNRSVRSLSGVSL
jgi:uncharacterized protein YjiS (DUF1127 family)